MLVRDNDTVNEIKSGLLRQLKEENAFWSYAPDDDFASLNPIYNVTSKDIERRIIKELSIPN